MLFPFPLVAKNYSHIHGNPVEIPREYHKNGNSHFHAHSNLGVLMYRKKSILRWLIGYDSMYRHRNAIHRSITDLSVCVPICLCVWFGVVAVPNAINEDRLCHDQSLQRDEWPWIGKTSVRPINSSTYSHWDQR